MTQPLRAGGLLYRVTPAGTELLIVHRTKYQDWSFPRGKVDDGENLPAAALREVFEETGMHCALGSYAGTVIYDSDSDPKLTHYWWMTVQAGQFIRNSEVDDVRWCALPKLPHALSAAADRHALAHWKGQFPWLVRGLDR